MRFEDARRGADRAQARMPRSGCWAPTAMCAVLCALMVSGALLGCGARDRPLRVDGPEGYVRCAASAAPPARSWSVGSRRMEVRGRSLTIAAGSDAADLPKVVAFRGPVRSRTRRNEPGRNVAEDTESGHSPHQPLAESGADVALWLGGLGGDAKRAQAAARRMRRLPFPVLFVAGGADRADLRARLFTAEAADDGLVDATGLRRIRLGRLEIIPVAGAPGGRYALDGQACGLSEHDAQSWSLAPPEPGVLRMAAAWAAPRGSSGEAYAAGLFGMDAGSALTARILKRAEVEVGVFAWPADALAPSSKFAKVPALSGPGTRRADGAVEAPGLWRLAASRWPAGASRR